MFMGYLLPVIALFEWHPIFHSKFVAEDVFAALPDCTVLMGVPTFYTRLLQQPGLNREHVSNVECSFVAQP